MAVFAEGVPPTAMSPLVVEALVAVENSIVGECPKALVHPSMDETETSGSEGEQPTEQTLKTLTPCLFKKPTGVQITKANGGALLMGRPFEATGPI